LKFHASENLIISEISVIIYIESEKTLSKKIILCHPNKKIKIISGKKEKKL
jgi:hypothetical protein